MTLTKIKGHEFNVLNIRDSHSRRAQRFKNNIIESLKMIGLTEDDIDIELEPVAIKNLPASASWYVEGMHLHYTYKACNKYAENLYVVSKVIELEIRDILNGEKTISEFIDDFTESHEVEEERKAARELLGVDQDSINFEEMTKKYKDLAKKAHPDMPTGDTERFKALNRAHKILKRELE
ncbi:DnaJ domain-containing protein [Candidatus Woesearchaeota archaeon]|nr:DnaJ domain-containing protein [Candidatus Woesearchaeota archaeon]MCF7901136.1 DnaJ domain-containing protein [Candidatus Woesearchaeota archaeon]MCF8013687.1 DnaJ domain-containing protein [Candidatus Woesearchaeota archaeon]